MFTRRRSRAFLLDTINRGAEFVETLKMIYPMADDLHEKDFDWLFDCSQAEQFLEWFCNTLGEENVLDPAEVEAYEQLLISEKPVLEDDALAQVLKACHQSSQLKCVMQENEVLPLETMEQEMRMLKNQHACQIKRHSKLQIRTASLKQELCHLAEKKEKASKELKKAHLELQLTNFQSNEILIQTGKAAKELVRMYQEPGHEPLKASLATADLGHYLKVEETFTKALLGFIPKLLPDANNDMEADKSMLAENGQKGYKDQLRKENVAGLVQKVWQENKSVPHDKDCENHEMVIGVLKSPVIYQGKMTTQDKSKLDLKALLKDMDHVKMDDVRNETLAVQHRCQRKLTWAVPDQMENLNNNHLGNHQEELGCMKLAYMCSQRSLVIASAEIKGIWACLQWANKTLKVSKEKKIEEEQPKLHVHIAACQEQLHILQSEVDRIETQHLVPLLHGSARLLRLPVLCGELVLEAITLRHTESIQEEAIGQMMGQLTHLELLRLFLMVEKKDLHLTGTKLEEMATILNEFQAKLQERQSCFADSQFSIKQCPRTLIDPSDLTTLRLWEMLDKHGQEKQLFHAYETLAGQGSRLCQELRMLHVQLATPLSHLPKLESDNEVLHCMMHGDSKQLALHAQEIVEPLEKLSTTQAKLYQMLMETLSDLKAKRKSLQSHFQQTERRLYVLFFNNPDQLKEMVEHLENQALAFSQA
ncbi:HAUS augmin-like complex subunit 3 [Heteronotia binoei]|uniref:HAUS augmin-like complex subunit 3 n=1 Tax=Heteronotia binoei TaxID=13085 RepID=UPI00292FE658|nr:HAUS augmin-like complex subunit 3 [Heteronotia binoei]XP_060095983.1 HAUS augmin-like complex subunit 3 [Heteronotia binoei]XP_060095984.1 HAUS augmin-like complex subunit 3 [Heteronotia binoei]